ncbi:hypothetical protein [Xanthomonas bonasiae]|uniref:hypothetical protein n=1 Tax=Xanthomonas bonasiae TaxID=2810351 RepID=UPI00197D4AB6|nr:hypothetical protein [Xanthomonas bonasiae]MBN6112445.1 hypothetical protein [Xanthomonas bonasiae]
MEIHEIDGFADDLEQIEEFCVFIAANRRMLNAYGLRRALRYGNSGSVISMMKELPEKLASAKRTIIVIDKQAASEIDEIEKSSNILEQIGLIALQLRIANTRLKPDELSMSLLDILSSMPYIGRIYSGNSLVSDTQISIQKTILGLQRLRASLLAFHSHYSHRNYGDNDLFKPSQLHPKRVVELIDAAALVVESSIQISIEQKQIINNYINEAKSEAASKYPSWSKIVGILMIVAAITSGVADAKGAAQNIHDAIRYIIEVSSDSPLLGNERLRLDYDASEKPAGRTV